MANVRLTLEEAAARGKVDRSRVDALTEADIARFNAEDGFDPDDALSGLRRVFSPAEIRQRIGLTQAQIAARLDIPLSTWRIWEEERSTLEPVVQAFLDLVVDDPERAFRIRSGWKSSVRQQAAG